MIIVTRVYSSGQIAELVARRTVCPRAAALVAIATRVHASRDFFLQHVARLYRSMTLSALQPRLDVRRVAKEDEIRNSVDRHPGDCLALFGGGPDLRHIGAVRLHRLMALHAEVGGRNFCVVALINPGVAEVTWQADVRRVCLVTERNRLRRYRLGKLLFLLP